MYSATGLSRPLPSRHENILYNINTMLVQRGSRRCINVIQMFCVCWGTGLKCFTRITLNWLALFFGQSIFNIPRFIRHMASDL